VNVALELVPLNAKISNSFVPLTIRAGVDDRIERGRKHRAPRRRAGCDAEIVAGATASPVYAIFAL
jgi:hypothetical protein